MNSDSISDIISGIYAITDPNLLTSQTALLDAVDAALAQGVRVIQYRDKLASSDQKLERAKAIHRLCKRYQAVSIINDSLELMIAADADGVHLGQTDGATALTELDIPKQKIIGVTCHDDIELAILAQQHGASYAAFGRFYPSNTKPHAKQAKIETLIEAKQELSIPVVAIGGINAHNMSPLLDAGADCIAVIDAIFGQNDTQQAANTLVSTFNRLTAGFN